MLKALEIRMIQKILSSDHASWKYVIYKFDNPQFFGKQMVYFLTYLGLRNHTSILVLDVDGFDLERIFTHDLAL